MAWQVSAPVQADLKIRALRFYMYAEIQCVKSQIVEQILK
jgi:hypothetical protein